MFRIKETFNYIHSWQKIKTNKPKKYTDMTPAKQVPDEDWETLIFEMDNSIPDIKRVLDNEIGRGDWADELRCTAAPP